MVAFTAVANDAGYIVAVAYGAVVMSQYVAIAAHYNCNYMLPVIRLFSDLIHNLTAYTRLAPVHVPEL